MELNYRKQLRMPIKYLPGFQYGFNGYGQYNQQYWSPVYGSQNIPKYNFDSNVSLSNRFGNNTTINGQYGTTGVNGSTIPQIFGNGKYTQRSRFNPGSINAAGILSSGINMYSSVRDAFGDVKSSDQIMNESGSGYGSVNGFKYEKLNDINGDPQRAEVKSQNTRTTLATVGSGAALGATIGSTLGPVGGVVGGAIGAVGGLITGIFAGGHRKRKLERRLREAEIRKTNINDYNLSSAQSGYMINDYYNQNGDTRDDMLTFKNGKDQSISVPNGNKNSNVVTSAGKIQAPANARVAAGESVIDNIDDVNKTTGYVVKDGELGKDTNLANLNNSTVVLGQDIDWRNGKTFRDQSLPYTLALEKINKKYENRTNDKINKLRGRLGQDSDKFQQEQVNKIKQPIVDKLKDLSERQSLQHQYSQNMQTNNQLPGYKDGKPNYGYIEPASWMSNAVPMGIGMMASLGQYFQAKKQGIHTPDIYAANPYEQAALQEQAKLRINPYNAIQKVYDQDNLNRYMINRAGGLSGAQKYLANVAAGLSTQRELADTIQKAQEINNQYRGKWAESAANLGVQYASRRQQANQYNTEYASQAHAARQQGMQMGLRNFMDYIQQYAANEYKRRTGNGMLGLYQQKVDMDRENMRSYYNKDNREAGDLIVPTQPVVGDVVYPNITSGVYNIQNPGTIKLRNNKQLNNAVRYFGYPTQNVQPYQYIPNTNYITNFTQMPPVNYKWNDII